MLEGERVRVGCDALSLLLLLLPPLQEARPTIKALAISELRTLKDGSKGRVE